MADNPVSHDDLRLVRHEMGEMRQVMSRMADAIEKVVVLDERQRVAMETNTRILESIEEIREGQHRTELRFAEYGDMKGRIERLETATRDLHVEREKDKASFQTTVKTIKGLWAVFGVGILAVGAFVIKAFFIAGA